MVSRRQNMDRRHKQKGVIKWNLEVEDLKYIRWPKNTYNCTCVQINGNRIDEEGG